MDIEAAASFCCMDIEAVVSFCCIGVEAMVSSGDIEDADVSLDLVIGSARSTPVAMAFAIASNFSSNNRLSSTELIKLTSSKTAGMDVRRNTTSSLRDSMPRFLKPMDSNSSLTFLATRSANGFLSYTRACTPR